MTDKRIVKTKSKIREGFVELLGKKTFEQITVTELCKQAKVSRLTFYTYFDNKYDCIEDWFQDLLDEVMMDLERKQRQNNPENNAIEAYCNLLDAILDLHDNYERLFQNAVCNENNYLFYYYYQFCVTHVEEFAAGYVGDLKSNYPLNQITSFLCDGIWGFIHSGKKAGKTREQFRPEAVSLLKHILESEIFSQNQEELGRRAHADKRV